MKGVSVKMGSRNSVHVESINEFKQFLLEHSIPENIINDYLKFHYADGTLNNTGKKRLSAEDYKKDHQSSIDEINLYFNNKSIILDAIDRFVLKGNNSEYPINAIILGVPNDFIWLTKNDIETVLSENNDYCSTPHFGHLVCQPMARCLNYNKKYEKFRKYVQIKWYSLFDDIIYQMNNNQMKSSRIKYEDCLDFQDDYVVYKKRAIHNE